MLSRGVQSSILDNRRQISELCLGSRHAEGEPPPPPGGACATARSRLLGIGRCRASPARRDEAARSRRRAGLASAAGSPVGPASWRPRPESKRASRHLRIARGNVRTPVEARALKNTLEKNSREETMAAACPGPRPLPPLWHPLSTCSPNRRRRWREAWAPEPRLAARAQCTRPPPRLGGPRS